MNTMIMLSQEELRKIVANAVTEALEAHDGKPALLDRTGLAKALSCSPSHVDQMRKKGLPTVLLGSESAPRFVLSDVLQWLGEGKEEN